MNPTFNLVDEPWIPCVMREGDEYTELSLRDVLARAPAIREVADPSPPVTVALHRLLLAIVHRVVQGPTTPEEWAALWTAGAWDVGRIDGYLAEWRRRFNLFDAEWPFYQTSAVDPSYAKPIGNMVVGMTLGNYTTLFDHTVETALTPAEAARQLLAYHAFTVGGMVGHQKGEPGLTHKFAKAGPLAKGAVVLIRGESLFHTLMFNLHHYNHEDEEPWAFGPNDRPAWERGEQTDVHERAVAGYLDLLTWQGRRVLLVPEQDDVDRTLVRRAVLMKGWQMLTRGWHLHDGETMMAFRENPNAKANEDPWPVVGFRADRALWRDSLALYQSVGGKAARPRSIDWIASQRRVVGHSARLQLDVSGIVTDQANIDLWRRERMPLSVSLLEDDTLLGTIGQVLSLAEEVGQLFTTGWDKERDSKGKQINVPRPLQILASELLATGQRNPDQKDVRALVDSLAPGDRYWAQIEAPFKAFLDDLPATSIDAALRGWAETLYQSARAAFRLTTRGIESNGRAMRAVAQAESRFHTLLCRRLGEWIVEPEAVPVSN